VGALGRAPEALIALDYARRASAVGRALRIGPVEIIEVEARKPGRRGEADAILAKAAGGLLIACDEHGGARTSRQFADRLASLRGEGVPRVSFAIGGADGLDPAVLDAAAERFSFGPLTWPHALARTMLAEQVYRALTILTGGPYHRD